MSRLSLTRLQKTKRLRRTRSKLSGTAIRPRLSINISNRHIRAQLIDDSAHKTLLQVNTLDLKETKKLNMTDSAVSVGKEIAKLAKAAKITEVVYDRGARKYHGRIKVLAEAAKEEGLKI